MASDSIVLRPAMATDLDAITGVFQACWSTSYAAVLPTHLVAAMSTERARTLWSRVLIEAAPGDVVVAVSDGDVAGVTRWEVAAGASHGWVHSLYVDPSAHGRGIGGRLLDAAETAIGRAGVTAGRLWVFAANSPSIAFYTAHGWAPDGSTRVEAEFGEPEIGLAKAWPAP